MLCGTFVMSSIDLLNNTVTKLAEITHLTHYQVWRSTRMVEIVCLPYFQMRLIIMSIFKTRVDKRRLGIDLNNILEEYMKKRREGI